MTAISWKDAARLAEIERELDDMDRRAKALEVEVTKILVNYDLAAQDMGSEIFDFVANDHDHAKLLKSLGLSAERSAEKNPQPLSNSRGGT